MSDTDEVPAEIEFETEGSTFVLRIVRGGSGLRGQVFRGEERIAGVQTFHTDDPELLLREAQRNRAVLRAATGD